MCSGSTCARRAGTRRGRAATGRRGGQRPWGQRPWSSRARCCGRDIHASARLADRTGRPQVVACTGVTLWDDYLPQFLENRDEDFIAELFVHDVEQGIQGTEIKAGRLAEAAADERRGSTPNDRVDGPPRGRASARCGPAPRTSRPTSCPRFGASGLELVRDLTCSRRASRRRRSRSRTRATPTTSTTSRACSTPACTSAWTATGRSVLPISSRAQRDRARPARPLWLRRADVPVPGTSTYPGLVERPRLVPGRRCRTSARAERGGCPDWTMDLPAELVIAGAEGGRDDRRAARHDPGGEPEALAGRVGARAARAAGAQTVNTRYLPTTVPASPQRLPRAC